METPEESSTGSAENVENDNVEQDTVNPESEASKESVEQPDKSEEADDNYSETVRNVVMQDGAKEMGTLAGVDFEAMCAEEAAFRKMSPEQRMMEVKKYMGKYAEECGIDPDDVTEETCRQKIEEAEKEFETFADNADLDENGTRVVEIFKKIGILNNLSDQEDIDGINADLAIRQGILSRVIMLEKLRYLEYAVKNTDKLTRDKTPKELEGDEEEIDHIRNITYIRFGDSIADFLTGKFTARDDNDNADEESEYEEEGDDEDPNRIELKRQLQKDKKALIRYGKSAAGMGLASIFGFLTLYVLDGKKWDSLVEKITRKKIPNFARSDRTQKK